MVELGTSSAFRGWVRVRVLDYGFGGKGRKVKSRDCALASDLVRAVALIRTCGYKSNDCTYFQPLYLFHNVFNQGQWLRGSKFGQDQGRITIHSCSQV